jgi:hypothetical protein
MRFWPLRRRDTIGDSRTLERLLGNPQRSQSAIQIHNLRPKMFDERWLLDDHLSVALARAQIIGEVNGAVEVYRLLPFPRLRYQ